jgi:hypothetical protein
MAEATSPTTGHRYGIARVCRVWERPRSSFYAARQPEADTTATAGRPTRRGPKPAISDTALLAAIRADLVRSPWTGEGHHGTPSRLAAMGARPRCGPDCGRWTASGCRASGCCG